MKNINATLLDRAWTSIFIAHRLRTVVEAGEVTHDVSTSFHRNLLYPACYFGTRSNHCTQRRWVFEQGTHEELMLARGLYFSLWQEQQAADTLSESSPAVV